MYWLLFPILLSAQPAPQADAPPPPRFEGSAEFSYVGTTGNSSTQTLGSGLATKLRLDGWTIASKAAVVRNKDREAVKAQSTSFSTEAGRVVRERMSVVVKYEFLRDRFAGTSQRHTAEAGVAVDAFANDRHTLKVRGAAGYANEQRIGGSRLSTAIATTGVTYAFALSESSSFENESAAEFSLQDSADQRVNNVASLSARLNSTFSLKVKHTVRWVKTPAPGFRKTDTITAVALVAKF